MKYLVTGGCGFLGSNLASEVIKRGDELMVLDNLYRLGSSLNLDWLRSRGPFHYVHADVRVASDVEHAVSKFKPDVIFHCAGQVAMTTSIEQPRLDFEVNVLGGINVLEAVRRYCPSAIITFSSTNKVYGDLEKVRFEETTSRFIAPEWPKGFDETLPLEFCSPYGCSKGALDQYMLDYARIFGLRTVVFRHSSIYGGRQFPTSDQGWVGWFISKALAQKRGTEKSFTIAGTGKQVRDLLFIDDIIDCYFSAIGRIDEVRGRAFNVGGGMENSLSVLELIENLEMKLAMVLRREHLPARQSDQKVFVADNSCLMMACNWSPRISKEEGLTRMIEWIGGQ